MRHASLQWIWYESPAFNAFRGDAWMPETCLNCPRREIDFGGCRCQAYLLTGDAALADPVCDKSPHHVLITRAVERAHQNNISVAAQPVLLYRDDKNSRALSRKTPIA